MCIRDRGSMMGGGVSVEIYGDDMDKLQEISDQIASQMEQIEGCLLYTSP